MNKIAVLTSGGDAPGMNAAIRATVRCAIDSGMEVYGINQGYEGLLNGDIKKLDKRLVGDILHKAGTVLRTARCERFMDPKWVDYAATVLKKYGISGLVIIGGDGSFHGGEQLAKRGISVACVPGTIDNDLAYTDFTIGFDSAVNTVLSAITNLRNTSSAHDRSVVVEVMGRHCGDIALYAGLAGGAEYALVPEKKTDISELIAKVRDGEKNGKLHSIIINAEGSGFESKEVAKQLEEATGKETRVVNLSYLQRGGEPTLQDRMLATIMAAKAVDVLKNGAEGTAAAIGIVAGKIISMELDSALNMEKDTSKVEPLIELIDVLSK